MTVGELIKALADYCPDTRIEALDGNLLTSGIHELYYGDTIRVDWLNEINDGRGGNPETLYLLTD